MSTQITLRQIPDEVEKRLRLRARKAGRSLNRTTIDLIEEALGVKPSAKKRRDISSLAGQWSSQECAAFERNTRIFEQIDKELWQL